MFESRVASPTSAATHPVEGDIGSHAIKVISQTACAFPAQTLDLGPSFTTVPPLLF